MIFTLWNLKKNIIKIIEYEENQLIEYIFPTTFCIRATEIAQLILSLFLSASFWVEVILRVLTQQY